MSVIESNNNNPLSIDDQKSNFLSPLIKDANELASEHRKRKNNYDNKGVHPADVADELTKGWEVLRPGKRTTRLKRLKRHDRWLEDRVWCLFRTMGYRTLNGANFNIVFKRGNDSVGKKQVDVYAEDERAPSSWADLRSTIRLTLV